MIRVKDIEKSLEFYENVIGLKLHHTMDLDDCKLYFLSDEFGYTQIELTANFETPKDGYKKGENFGHFAFEIDDFQKVEEKLKQYNIEYLYEPYDMGNMKIAFVTDPDGNEIELIKNK